MQNFYNWFNPACWANYDHNQCRSAVQKNVEHVSKVGQVLWQNAQAAGNKNVAFSQKRLEHFNNAMQEDNRTPERMMAHYQQAVTDLYNHFKEMSELGMKSSKEFFDLYTENATAMAGECVKNTNTKPAR